MKLTDTEYQTALDNIYKKHIEKEHIDVGTYTVRRATGKRKHGARWEVVRTLPSGFSHVVLCYSNWKKTDCDRYARWSNEGSKGEFIHP